jgi:hypothetical protein
MGTVRNFGSAQVDLVQAEFGYRILLTADETHDAGLAKVERFDQRFIADHLEHLGARRAVRPLGGGQIIRELHLEFLAPVDDVVRRSELLESDQNAGSA